MRINEAFKEDGGKLLKKSKVLKLMLVVIIFCLSLTSAAYASSSVQANNIPKNENTDQSVNPNNTGLNINGAFISLNSTGTALWYSGKLTSANTWISASCQTSLEWQSPLGGSFQTEATNNPVYSENTNTMNTPTYIFTYPTWGYWRSTNTVVAYWPGNIIPSYWNNTFSCPPLYYEQ